MLQFVESIPKSMEIVFDNYELMGIILSYIDDVKDRMSFELVCKTFRYLSIYSILPSLRKGYFYNFNCLKILISYNAANISVNIGSSDVNYCYSISRNDLINEISSNDNRLQISLIGFLRRFLLQTKNVSIEIIDDDGNRDLEDTMWLDKIIVQLIIEMKCRINEITLSPVIYPCRSKSIYETLKYIYKSLSKMSINVNLILDILWRREDEDFENLEYDLFYKIFKSNSIISVVIAPKDITIQCSFKEWMKLYFDIKFIRFESILKAVFLIDCRCVCCSQTSAKIYQSFLRNSPLYELSLNFSPFNVLNPSDIFCYIPDSVDALHLSNFMDNFDAYECLNILKSKRIKLLEINNADCFQFVDIGVFIESFPFLRALSLSEIGATFTTQLAEYLLNMYLKNNIEFLQFFSKFETKAFIALKNLKQKFKYSRMDPLSFECVTLGFNYANDELLIREYNN
uniref:F-box domain-containing protein n=1 Tax=Parastrongyloides trichosuri TaxID=131310 RepID=A0A0N4ZH19_PARTI